MGILWGRELPWVTALTPRWDIREKLGDVGTHEDTREWRTVRRNCLNLRWDIREGLGDVGTHKGRLIVVVCKSLKPNWGIRRVGTG